jgi:hypothetical protein
LIGFFDKELLWLFAFDRYLSGTVSFDQKPSRGALHDIAHFVRIAFETAAALRGSSVGPLARFQSVISRASAVVAAQALDAVFLITRDLARQREPAIEQEMRDRHDKRPRPDIRVECEVT